MKYGSILCTAVSSILPKISTWAVHEKNHLWLYGIMVKSPWKLLYAGNYVTKELQILRGFNSLAEETE